MCAYGKRNIDVSFSGRRRSSTQTSVGLDYSTCSHVEGDVLIRIRSLLLSRNLHYPPRTPYSSDDESRTPRKRLTISGFDFSTAKSVAKRVREEGSRLSLPNPGPSWLSSLQPAMEVQAAGLVPTRAASKMKSRVVIRNSSSADDLTGGKLRQTTEPTQGVGRLLDDKTIHDTLITCCPPCHPEREKSAFKIPRLCLLPKEHVRPQYDLSSIAPAIANLGLRIRDIKAQPPKLVVIEKKHSVLEDVEQILPTDDQTVADDCGSEIMQMHDGTNQKNYVVGDSHTKGPSCEDSAQVAHPNNETQQLHQNEQEINSEARVVRPAQSTLSLHARPYTPSLQSGMSRTSTHRHALLKTTATPSEPLDLGLPVPPVLTLASSNASSRFQRHTVELFDMKPKELTDCLNNGLDSKAKAAKNSVSPNQQLGTETVLATKPVVCSVDPCALKSDELCHDYESLEDAARTAAQYLSRTSPWHSSSISSFGGTGDSFGYQLEGSEEITTETRPDRSSDAFLEPEAEEVPLDQRPIGIEEVHEEHPCEKYEKHQTQAHEAVGKSRNSSKSAGTGRSLPWHLSVSHIPTRFSSYERIVVRPESYEELADRLESQYLNSSTSVKAPQLTRTISRSPTSSLSNERVSAVSETYVQSAERLEAPDLAASASLFKGTDHSDHEEEETATISSKWNSKSSWLPFKSKPAFGQEEISGRDAKSRFVLGERPKKSLKDRVAKQLSIDHLSGMAGHKLRSVSSMSSTRTDSVDEPRRGIWKSSNSKLPRDSPKLKGKKQDKTMGHDKLGRAPIVYSSQGIGTDGEGYTTEFTSLPARHHHLTIQPRILRSGSSKSDGELYPGTTSEQHNRFASAQVSEALTQTINDIENLLNEALFIAHQAAESHDVEMLPRSFKDAAAVPKSGQRWKIDEKKNWHRFRRGYFKQMFHSRRFEDRHSLQSCYERNGALPSEGLSTESVIEFDENQELSDQLNHVTSHISKEGVLVSPVPLTATRSQKGEENDGEPFSTPMPTCLKTSMNVAPLEAVETLQNAEAVKNAPQNGGTHSVEKQHTKHSRLPSIRDGNADPASLAAPELAVPFELLSGQTQGTDRAGSLVGKETRRASRSPNQKGADQYKGDIPTVTSDQKPPGPLHHEKGVKKFKRGFHTPDVEPRGSSLMLRKSAKRHEPDGITSAVDFASMNRDPERATLHSLQSLDGSGLSDHETDLYTPADAHKHRESGRNSDDAQRYELHDTNDDDLPQQNFASQHIHNPFHNKIHLFDLRGQSHVSLKGSHGHGFSLSRSHKRRPIARDWSPLRKRFVATVACISTALIGILVGIYAGEVPSIQYYIADFEHFAILGNVFFYVGIAIPTMFFWPLPLLHGRKPYILASMSIAMPLLFPQAVVISVQRSPYVPTFRIGLILPRAFMGFVLGFANMNFLAILTDLFGASLQSGNPHQEVVDENDVRRHGGGLGVWLGIWTWCYMGSIGFGFMIGACIINTYSPDWGLYVSIIIIAAVLVLNVITPEVRRSAYRRSVTEVRTNKEISRRLAKGEVKMHRVQTGPTWWGEEFHHGVQLSLGMIRQPGFLIMALYVAWIYGQIVLVIVLLGSLMSKVYHMTSPYVGAATCAIPIGALLAIPFQKASLFSRDRHHPQRTDSMTFQERVSWSSHLVRRAVFTLVLPFAGLAYTLSSTGPPIPFIIPVIFAGLIAFLSNLAIAECNGIIMEAFDTSDLQPGLTGRRRGASGDRSIHKRTNYSSFPRVSSAFAITQGLGFLIAATATGVGGVAQRNLGQQAATGVMAGILLILTILLLGILIRWKEVQIIPTTKTGDMESWDRIRKSSGLGMQKSETTSIGQSGMMTPVKLEEEPWRPTIIGNPSGKTRRMSILELGSLSRWSEIRRKNRLVKEEGLESRHPNLAALGSARDKLREVNIGVIDTVRERSRLRRDESRRTAMSDDSIISESEENGDLGGRRRNRRRLITVVPNGKGKEKVAH